MSGPSLDVAVLGVGLWAEGLGDWDDACAHWRGQAQARPDAPAPARPRTTLLPPAERRRAPATVLLALAVAEQACREAGVAPQSLRSVFASAHGDLELTDYLCATLAESPEHLSPTRFHHSVHNAASGYWTIGVGNVQASTAMSAGPHSLAQGLLEAATQVLCEQVPVLLVAYDMPAPAPLVPITSSTALVGLAMVLAPVPLQPSAPIPPTLALRLLDRAEPPAKAVPSGDSRTAALLPRNPIAIGLPLAEALATCGQGTGEGAEFRFMLSPAQSLIVALAGRNGRGRR